MNFMFSSCFSFIFVGKNDHKNYSALFKLELNGGTSYLFHADLDSDIESWHQSILQVIDNLVPTKTDVLLKVHGEW